MSETCGCDLHDRAHADGRWDALNDFLNVGSDFARDIAESRKPDFAQFAKAVALEWYEESEAAAFDSEYCRDCSRLYARAYTDHYLALIEEKMKEILASERADREGTCAECGAEIGSASRSYTLCEVCE